MHTVEPEGPGLGERELWLFSSGPVGEGKGDPEQLERFTRPPRVQQIAATLGGRAAPVRS